MVYLLDTVELEETTAETLVYFQWMMIIVGGISFTIAFFLLMVSTSQNIKENLWEFGVLRSIGLRKDQVQRVYVYEASSVVVSAIFFGFLVGFLLAVVISLQFNLFVELPFSVPFPWTLVAVMIVLSCLTTLAASILPTREVNEKQIATILKST